MATTQQLYVLEFDDLPGEIVRWLRSAEVDSLNEQLATRYQLEGEALKAVPFVTTWLAMGYIAPEETISALIADFGISKEKAPALAGDIQKLIFAPIKIALREKLGFIVENITAEPAPQAKTPVSKPATTSNTYAPVASAPAPRQPEKPVAVPPQPSRVAPVVPRARVTVLPRPLMTDIRKKTESAPTPAGAPKKAGPATISTEKPFGFTEVEPTPPPHTELASYEDHHPVVE